MARRSRGSKTERLILDDTLGELACSAVGTFLFDPDGMTAYRKTQTAAGRRKASRLKLPEPLDTMDMTDGGTIAILPGPVEWNFGVVVTHHTFKALIATVYDPNTDDDAMTEILAFDGDMRKATTLARKWIEELDEDDDEDPWDGLPSLDELIESLADLSGEGGERLPRDAEKRVRDMATRMAVQVRAGDRFDPTPSDMAWMEQNLGCLDVILEQYVEACTADTRNDVLIDVYLRLLTTQLELIRFRAERGWDSVNELIEDYQTRIVELADGEILKAEDWYHLPATFTQAGLTISEDTAAAFGRAGAAISSPPPDGDLPAMLRNTIDEMAREIGDPFQLIGAVSEITAALPSEMRGDIATEFALSSNPLAREAVPMLLLAPEVEVRKAAVAALEQTALPDTFSSASLRRVIAVRTWVPAAERPALDRVIRKAREKGVEIAPWPAAAPVIVTASMIDGVDAQSIVVTSAKGRIGVLGLILLKHGVKDTGCDPEAPRREMNDGIATLRDDALGSEVDRAYLDTAIGHAIASGLAQGSVPPAGLLHIAECIGAADWKERALDPAEEIATLFATLTPEEQTEAAIKASLARSEKWTRDGDVFDTWYEDSKAVYDLLARGPRELVRATKLVMDEVLEKERGTWATRLLLLTQWARAAKEKARHTRWKDFLVLAHCLTTGRALADIPLMHASARLSVLAVRNGVR